MSSMGCACSPYIDVALPRLLARIWRALCVQAPLCLALGPARHHTHGKHCFCLTYADEQENRAMGSVAKSLHGSNTFYLTFLQQVLPEVCAKEYPCCFSFCMDHT